MRLTEFLDIEKYIILFNIYKNSFIFLYICIENKGILKIIKSFRKLIVLYINNL